MNPFIYSLAPPTPEPDWSLLPLFADTPKARVKVRPPVSALLVGHIGPLWAGFLISDDDFPCRLTRWTRTEGHAEKMLQARMRRQEAERAR